MDLFPLLKKFSQAPGASGFEKVICSEIKETWSPLADEVRTDRLGNLFALKRGNNSLHCNELKKPKTIMIAAHMDEIALMVTNIQSGFLSITNVGGIDKRLLLGQPVTVHGRRDLAGVIGSRPPHLLSLADREKQVPLDQMVVDVGLSPEEVDALVRVGDLITFRQELRELLDDRVAGKALDNRASVVAVTHCLQLLQDRTHQWDVMAVATVQEEETLAGALTSTFDIEPDIGIAVDTTFATGPGVSKSEALSLALDAGPAIGFGPNNHPGVHRALVDTAKRMEMAYQIEPMPRGGGTDAWAMEVVRSGIPTGVVSIPIRNMHMPVEIVVVRDIRRAGRLVAEFVAFLNEDFAPAFLSWDRENDEGQNHDA